MPNVVQAKKRYSQISPVPPTAPLSYAVRVLSLLSKYLKKRCTVEKLLKKLGIQGLIIISYRNRQAVVRYSDVSIFRFTNK